MGVHDREHRTFSAIASVEARNRGQCESAIPTQTSPGESKIVDRSFKARWKVTAGIGVIINRCHFQEYWQKLCLQKSNVLRNPGQRASMSPT